MKMYMSKKKMADKLEEEMNNLDAGAVALREDAELPMSLKACPHAYTRIGG